MVVNFRIREISRGMRKLVQTPILIIIKKKLVFCFSILQCPQLFPVLDISYMLPYCTLLNKNLQEIILSSVILVIMTYQGTVLL